VAFRLFVVRRTAAGDMNELNLMVQHVILRNGKTMAVVERHSATGVYRTALIRQALAIDYVTARRHVGSIRYTWMARW
jgi:hypothetical protein